MNFSKGELQNLLQESLAGMKIVVPQMDQHRLTQIIWDSMSQPSRVFHTAEHLFDVFISGQPLVNLALLFHDVVYYQVDRSFLPELAPIFKPELVPTGERFRLRIFNSQSDMALETVSQVFGYQPSQELDPRGGMNEFLSALASFRLLERFATLEDRIAICACIEATIPFRSPNADGLSNYDLLFQRLEDLKRRQKLKWSTDDIENIVCAAVRTANTDISNFSSKSLSHFLENTWKIIAESNPSLRTQSQYTVLDYRNALLRMSHFFSSITADRVIGRFRNEPTPSDFEKTIARVDLNLTKGDKYLRGKLLAIAILEAFAECTGGDVPLYYFTGSLVNGAPTGPQIESFLPQIGSPPPTDTVTGGESTLDPDIVDLFENGRSGSSIFDIQRSPIASYLYRKLGYRKLEKFVSSAEQMWMKSITPREFLKRLDQPALKDIVIAAGHIATDRKEKLLQLV